MTYEDNNSLQIYQEFTCKTHKKIKIVSLKLQAFESSRAKQKEEERMRTHAQYTGR